jgi:NAD(P)H-hydrate epimerase
MYVLTNRQMREADNYTINELGVPSLELMERAGAALADEAQKMSPNGKILCVCGGGNNGGDGFVCARILQERGRETAVVLCADKMSSDCKVNYRRWWDMHGRCLVLNAPDKMQEINLQEISLIVDCLFGTGFRGALKDNFAFLTEWMNEAKKQGIKILSADIPSGVNGDNGLVENLAVQADKTLCIGEIKSGVLLADGIDYAGEVVKADIGIALLSDENYAELSNSENIAALLPQRKGNTHKGSNGKAAIVAGSIEYTGAAYLSASACLRAGAGYTALFLPKEILPYYILKAPEILLQGICDGDRFSFDEENMQPLLGYDSIAYGMGMGTSEAVAKGARYLLENYKGKLVLDADGLNSLAKYEKDNLKEIFKNKKCDVVVTPHVKEFSRLTQTDTAEILKNGLSAPCDFAKKHKVSVLLKNAVSILTDGEHISVNATGTAGQAKGGSGDVLSGAIAGLCAGGISAYDGARIAAYIIGRAAELATSEIGVYSLTATDLIAYMGRAFLEISS